jgi:glutamyl-tRNA(Gln) amidotransferase subunit D
MAEQISPGDTVKVEYEGKTVEGMLMPRSDMLNKDVTVVKLENGYNIGIDTKKIKKMSLVKKFTPVKVDKVNHHSNAKLPTVSVLSTGGTISSKVDYRTGGVYADYTAEDFMAMCPELKDIANINAKKVMSIMSEDIDWHDWEDMAKAIVPELLDSKVDGVVVTCGTDTLHFISSALSFFIKNINKPVVITASQRSIDRGSSDAFMNLSCAIQAAAKFDGAEVMTCLHGTTNDDYCILIRGTKVRKMHTSRRDAFRPINEKAFAKVYPAGKIEIINTNYKKKSDIKPELDAKYQEKVCMILAYPGQDPDVIDYYVNKGYKGIVIAATALGHVATWSKKSLIPNIKKAVDKGIPVIIATQTIYGRVHPYVYTNLRKLSVEAGAIFAEDMLPETAYVKLGYALGHSSDMAKVKEMMQKNLRGEINERLSDDDFLY